MPILSFQLYLLRIIIQHIETDINQGGNELENHVAMSDETLIN
ncbi:MAG: hypothetical protein QM500_16865 [Methylococcales bacterium]